MALIIKVRILAPQLRWLAAGAVLTLSACGTLDLGDGGDVAFTRGFAFIRRDDRNVYLADQQDYSSVARLSSGGGARHPSLSRDGKKVVYVRTTASQTDLMLVGTAAGSVPGVIFSSTSAQKNFRTPVFSHDGQKLSFAYDDGAASVIGIVNIDGSGFARLVGGSAASYGAPSFYPDGAAVLTITGSSPSNYTRLAKVELTGSVTTIGSGLGSDVTQISNRAVVSPDGSYAAFDGRLVTGASRIFVMRLDLGQVTQLTDYPGEPNASDSFPCWEGSDRVAFSSDSGGSDQVYALSKTAVRTSGGLELPTAVEPWFGPSL